MKFRLQPLRLRPSPHPRPLHPHPRLQLRHEEALVQFWPSSLEKPRPHRSYRRTRFRPRLTRRSNPANKLNSLNRLFFMITLVFLLLAAARVGLDDDAGRPLGAAAAFPRPPFFFFPKSTSSSSDGAPSESDTYFVIFPRGPLRPLNNFPGISSSTSARTVLVSELA
ncbi:hypothetical protein GCK72_017334 [Caenorhabditis remanei]|uniref:Uncharacterized protein n=1 Tax=Caenorhabditis remanei TaxID=31234 RepID=A0A6A5G7R6_CAERE|nr:hypothetical protein GCK72_017334 [Caenorhabditis remanei]KAF1750783.1 hypothetical protein GCK72_017334 [Caenorhabditis remanei]